MSNQVNRKACRTARVRYQRSTMHGCSVTAWWPIVKQGAAYWAVPSDDCKVRGTACSDLPRHLDAHDGDKNKVASKAP